MNKIIIPSSVKIIEGVAFQNCESLTDVVIPSSVTTMGSNVFYAIPSITVHVPWKEGEKPEGWDDNWASSNAVIDYAK